MLTFWAKSGRPDDTATMHSVPHHSLDVAACALLVARVSRPPAGVEAATLATLVALHDVGKFTRTFQGKVGALWPDCLGPFTPPRAGWPHDDADYALLSGPLARRLDGLFGATPPFSRWSPILTAIAGHHGRPPRGSQAASRAMSPAPHASRSLERLSRRCWTCSRRHHFQRSPWRSGPRGPGGWRE